MHIPRSNTTTKTGHIVLKPLMIELRNLANKIILRLKKLKEKLSQQRKHLDELDSHIAELEKERGGEHN